MKPLKPILLENQKFRSLQIKDKNLVLGEFRTYYKPHPNLEYLNQIKCSGDFFAFLKPVFELQMEDSEKFIAVYLSKANRIIHYTEITVVDIQLILRHAILLNAKGICLSHNHPSGNLAPSDADIAITRKVKEAAKLMEISVLEHIILVIDKYYSFADNGLL